MEFGKKIKQLRYKNGLTQEQLAEKVGLGAQSVSKWETGASMPDITLLPLLAETFGVTIDDLFDLSVEQRFNRMENRMDAEKELPGDLYRDYEDFLKARLNEDTYQKRATELIAYLYWHRMNADAQRVRRYAKESIRLAPDEKGCQWMLQAAEGHTVWDWNIGNHTKAIAFYRELTRAAPESYLPYMYLIDNLLADRRADEAERYLARMRTLKGANPVMAEVYRAHIALARFDEPAADAIMERLASEHPDDAVALFEAAQYYAGKCGYEKAIEYYERSFEKTDRRPRFTDELYGIAAIYEIMGEYEKAAGTFDRIIALLRDEWGLTEDDDSSFGDAQKEKARLLAMAK